MPREASGITYNLSDIAANPFDLRSAWDIVLAFGGMPNDEGEGGEEGEGEGGDEGSDSGGDDDKGSEGKDESKVKDPDKKRLSDEAARHRTTAKAEKTRADAAEAKLRELEDKDKGELEKAQRDLKELAPKVEKLEGTVKAQAVELAFFKSGTAAQFRDPEVALRLLRDDLKEVEVDAEGEVDADAIKKAAKALLDQKTYLKASESDDDDNDEDLPSGRRTNGKAKKKGEADRAALTKKFPALNR